MNEETHEEMNGDRTTPVPPAPVDDGTLIALLRAQATHFASVFVRLDRIEARVGAVETHLHNFGPEAPLRARIAELEAELARARGA